MRRCSTRCHSYEGPVLCFARGICDQNSQHATYNERWRMGRNVKTSVNLWWLQLLKRQILTFLPSHRFGTERSEVRIRSPRPIIKTFYISRSNSELPRTNRERICQRPQGSDDSTSSRSSPRENHRTYSKTEAAGPKSKRSNRHSSFLNIRVHRVQRIKTDTLSRNVNMISCIEPAAPDGQDGAEGTS